MTIEGYFWAVLIVLGAVMAALFGAGFLVGRRVSRRMAGISVGVTILIILSAVVGGAKALEPQIGPLILYEAAWIASAFNFALVAGYITGKNPGARSTARPAVPIVCAAIAIGSLYLMGARLHQLVQVMQDLGIGGPRKAAAGPDTSLDCNQSLKRIYLGFQHYADVNDALPPAAKWMDEEDLKGAVQADEWFHCPSVSNRKDDRYGYAYNELVAGRKLQGKKLSAMPDAAKTPLVYDSAVLSKDAHDAVTSLARPGRHGGRNNILYCDGHIERVAPE